MGSIERSKMANVSTVGDMPNITGNFSGEVYEHHESLYERIFLEVFTLIGLLSITSNILLSFVILKYKKMRENPTNKIFLHINILQSIYFLTTPLTLRVAMAFLHPHPVSLAVFCVSYQLEINLLFGVAWFIFLLICDWYLRFYHKDTYAKFSRVYKFFVIFLYLLIVLASSITIQACFRNLMLLFTYLIMLVGVGLLLLFLCIINIVHAIRKRRISVNNRRGNIGLAIANICFLCWLPGFIYFLVGVGGIYINAPIIIIVLFAVGFSSPVFNVIYLYNCDDNYHIFLKQVFRCKCSEYKNESLDNASVSYNGTNGVQIPDHV